VDVRDVARAAVLSLKTQPPQPGERRRILLWGGTFTWKQAVKHIAAAKPELKARLVDRGEPSAEQEAQAAGVDTSKAGEVLGLNEFIGWKQTVEDTVDSLLKREPTWTN
jgi:nucleoside-diphosphate-sugar epimerase